MAWPCFLHDCLFRARAVGSMCCHRARRPMLAGWPVRLLYLSRVLLASHIESRSHVIWQCVACAHVVNCVHMSYTYAYAPPCPCTGDLNLAHVRRRRPCPWLLLSSPCEAGRRCSMLLHPKPKPHPCLAARDKDKRLPTTNIYISQSQSQYIFILYLYLSKITNNQWQWKMEA